jgi:hypothetical protein
VEASEVRAALIAVLPELAGPLDDGDRDAIEEGWHYLEMSAVARFLQARLSSGNIERLDLLFDVVERCIRDGTADEANLVVVGLLEDLQDSRVSREVDYARWEPYLGPSTREAWRAITDYWSGHPEALDQFFDSLGSAPQA